MCTVPNGAGEYVCLGFDSVVVLLVDDAIICLRVRDIEVGLENLLSSTYTHCFLFFQLVFYMHVDG